MAKSEIMWINFDPQQGRHAEPLYAVFEDDWVNDGLEHLREEKGWYRCRVIREPTTPQQEPEGDGWEITDEDLDAIYGPGPRPLRREIARIIRDRLRARVQPRTVSEAEWKIAVTEFEDVADELDTELALEAFCRQLRVMPTITPTEEQDQRAGERS